MIDDDFASLRARTGLSIDELSEKLDYSPRQLYRWETGEHKPRTTIIQALKLLIEPKGSNNNFYFKFIDLFAVLARIP